MFASLNSALHNYVKTLCFNSCTTTKGFGNQKPAWPRKSMATIIMVSSY